MTSADLLTYFGWLTITFSSGYVGGYALRAFRKAAAMVG